MSNNFALDISKIVDRTKMHASQVARGIKIELFDSVIMDTRVGNPDIWKSPPPPGYVGGRMRGNWQTQEDSPIMGEIDRIDPTGIETLSEVRARVGTGATYMTNNVPYVKRWEDEDAMVAKNMARIDQIVRKEAAK